MYQEHWGLKLLPFENVPNPAFFYCSPTHEEALTRLSYTVSKRKGAAVIVGAVGCGKTTLGRALIRLLAYQRYHVAAMTNPALDPLDFLQMIMVLFKVKDNHCSSKGRIWQALERQLETNLQRSRGSVLVIDDAQVIHDDKTLEEITMLLNLQSKDKYLLNVILLGQPELEARIRHCEALLQRVAIRYRLRHLSTSETVQYIRYRLKAAGVKRMPFTSEALESIVTYTRGNPRVINQLCDRSLLSTYMAKEKLVTGESVREAWEDLK